MNVISSFGERLKALREQKNMTLADVADITGIPAPTLNRYELGQRTPKITMANIIAEKLGVSSMWLQGYDVPQKELDELGVVSIDVGQLLRFPIAAAIRAGFDGLAIEKSDEAITVPRYLLHGLPPDEVIVTRVSGNSMYPRLLDGDAIIVHRQPSVDSGDVAVVVYDGEDATVKIVRYENGCDWMDLVPANPEYMTRRIQGADLQECHVVGKVIGLIRDRI